MGNWAEEMFEAAFQIARAINDDPNVVAARKAAAARHRAALAEEEARLRHEREAREAEKAHRRSIDSYVLAGSGDECHRAGIMGQCCSEDCRLWAEDRCPSGERPPLTSALKGQDVGRPVPPHGSGP